jgi:hypothetical protein
VREFSKVLLGEGRGGEEEVCSVNEKTWGGDKKCLSMLLINSENKPWPVFIFSVHMFMFLLNIFS